MMDEEDEFLFTEESNLSDDAMREEFDILFTPGHIWTIQGPTHGEKKGTAKSTLGVQILQQAAENGYACATNIMLKRPVRDADGKIVSWEPKHGLDMYQSPEMKKAGGFIFRVLSFSQAAYEWHKRDVFKNKQKTLLVLDESMMVAGVRGGSGGGMQSREGVDVATFATQIRKLGLCIVILGLGDRFLSGIYRAGEEGSIVTGIIRRIKLPGYDVREVVHIWTPSAKEPVYIKTTPLRGIARPEWMLGPEPNDSGPVFESFSPATFTMGIFPQSKKPFSLGQFLIALSDVISDYTADAVSEFLESEGGKVSVVRPDLPSPNLDEEKEIVAPARADAIRDLLRANPTMSDSEIARMVEPPVSKQRVQKLRKEMREGGGVI